MPNRIACGRRGRPLPSAPLAPSSRALVLRTPSNPSPPSRTRRGRLTRTLSPGLLYDPISLKLPPQFFPFTYMSKHGCIQKRNPRLSQLRIICHMRFSTTLFSTSFPRALDQWRPFFLCLPCPPLPLLSEYRLFHNGIGLGLGRFFFLLLSRQYLSFSIRLTPRQSITNFNLFAICQS